jgi:DNA mismatch repair protein MutS2
VGEPGAGKVYVDVDGKRMKVPLDWLGKLDKPRPREPDQKIVVNVQRETAATYSLDLRGDRFEEARQRLQAFLDRAVLSNMTEVQIIHGKGTGVLKKLVADLLKSHKNVAEFNLGGLDEGGAGVTFVKLK